MRRHQATDDTAHADNAAWSAHHMWLGKAVDKAADKAVQGGTLVPPPALENGKAAAQPTGRGPRVGVR